MEFRASLFVPHKKKRVHWWAVNTLFAYVVLGSSMIAVIWYPKEGALIMVTSLFYILAMGYRSFTIRERPNGKIEGKVTFTDVSFSVGKDVYLYEQMDRVQFDLGDFFQKEIVPRHPYFGDVHKFSFRPNISQGVKNNISFRYHGEDHSYFFKLGTEKDLLVIYGVVGLMVKQGFLSCSDGYQAVNAIHYESIQDFKKRYCSSNS